ncbi:MalY/PatB family protein [Metabacillus arenae]|uniref:cysteine-S-conjugate beta-lyase n=1 Tax=Metabacillus arenae TaxID=2771434 RepID=A0A926RZT2_9BACI|nr:MalY/PatB family protein [Metabacillus arenae]MBD1382577.1 pyridoxal phosphate-dependent aminotransferase [Metabacillus arenae]
MSHFNTVINRKQTASVKWDLTKEIFGTDDLLPMWVADMDFPAPQEVLDALKNRLDHGIFGYTSTTIETKESICKWLKTRHGWEISEEDITYSSGVVTALSMAVQAYTEPGDKVIVQSPVYTPFFQMAKENDRIVENNQLILTNHQYEMDFEGLENILKEDKVKLLLLCNPHNPVGRVWTREELIKLGELCLKYNVVVVSDEIHSDLILFGHKHIPFASLSEEFKNNSITCIAPSKTFNLAGLQASAIIIPNDSLRRKFNEQQHRQGFFTLNTFGFVAMEAAYTYGEPWLTELLAYLEENVIRLKEFINQEIPNIKIIEPESTYLVWLDCRAMGLSDQELKRKLLLYGKIALEPGNKYGEGGEGFLRINLACPKDTLEEGLLRLKKALAS